MNNAVRRGRRGLPVECSCAIARRTAGTPGPTADAPEMTIPQILAWLDSQRTCAPVSGRLIRLVRSPRPPGDLGRSRLRIVPWTARSRGWLDSLAAVLERDSPPSPPAQHPPASPPGPERPLTVLVETTEALDRPPLGIARTAAAKFQRSDHRCRAVAWRQPHGSLRRCSVLTRPQ